MAHKHLEPKGSPILKVVIAILIVVLVVSVLYPRSLWKKHEQLIDQSRNRMDNLNSVVMRHNEVYGTWVADVDSLLTFMKSDSLVVQRSVFEFEKLSLYDADYDSFLVGFTDMFHFDHIEFESFSAGEPREPAPRGEGVVIDSVLMRMIPKPQFQEVIAPVEVALTSESGIRFEFRDKGEDDIYWTVWSPGMIDRRYMPYPARQVPSKAYLLTLPLEEVAIDPISDDTFHTYLNAKLTLEAEVEYEMVRRGEPDSAVAVSNDSLMANLLINKLARKARSRLEQDMKRDSSLYEQQIELQSDYFEMELELLRPGRPVTVESSRETMVPMDSVDNYRDQKRLEVELFKFTVDSLIKEWTDWEKTRETLAKLEYEKNAEVAKVNTVGVTIEPPFEGTYRLKGRNILDMIFSVGPIENPGYVENNDLSWSEKR